MLFSSDNIIDRYRIIKLLGQSGFSEAYLAYDKDLDRQIVIKFDVGRVLNKDRQYNWVLNEARILAQCQHPYIVTVFDMGWYDDIPYVVLEVLERSLEDELRGSSLAKDRVVSLMAELADAVDYVHRRGFIHRNLKPGVIFIDSTGHPKLGGFGASVAKKNLNSAQMIFTPAYMAPEQILNPDQLGDHTDIWALGIILYQMLTGRLPFEFKGDISNLAKVIMHEEPLKLRQIDPSVSEALEHITLKCLSKQPIDRYKTADRLAQELRSWRPGGLPHLLPRVFISHSSNDREFVEREIVNPLEMRGIKTWYSKISIQTAAEWERSIKNGIDTCEWFLLVMSKESALSEWVKDELFQAINTKPNRIVPVLIDEINPVDFHIRIARFQHIDLRFDIDAARQRMIGTLLGDTTSE